MIRIYLVLSLLLSIATGVNCQNTQSLTIDVSGKDCYLFVNSYNEKSDTTNYYIVFETFFHSDTVAVFANDIKVFFDTIETDRSTGIAKEIKVGKVESVEYMGFQINSEPIIYLRTIPGKFYVRVKHERDEGQIHICYSKFMFLAF
ncbi:MAG: hypothetical protein EA412_00860 [Chitinophagaceae bacterium]|nr:MAG: hypothetical protein EA412_00860 [Chitinophagaceae bacterium]